MIPTLTKTWFWSISNPLFCTMACKMRCTHCINQNLADGVAWSHDPSLDLYIVIYKHWFDAGQLGGCSVSDFRGCKQILELELIFRWLITIGLIGLECVGSKKFNGGSFNLEFWSIKMLKTTTCSDIHLIRKKKIKSIILTHWIHYTSNENKIIS